MAAAASLALLTAAPAAYADCKIGLVVELPVTMIDSVPTIQVKVNGQNAVFSLDSGSTLGGVSQKFADKLHLKRESRSDITVLQGGQSKPLVVANAKDFTFDQTTFHDLRFMLFDRTVATDGWLGQDFLGNLDIEYDLANALIRFIKPTGCGSAVLAYWAKDSFSIMPLRQGDDGNWNIGEATVNGKRVSFRLSSGSPRSALSQKAAAQAGLSAQTPGAEPSNYVTGDPPRLIDSWIVPVDEFSVGEEKIRKTSIRVGAALNPGIDMTLGADFFLSHRIYVSNAQHKAYFTYSGGPVFRFDSPSQLMADAGSAEGPKDSAGFFRRGLAFVARAQNDAALADFDHALTLNPANSDALAARASLLFSRGQKDKALADATESLRLQPDNVETLSTRGRIYASMRRYEEARVDLERAAKLGSPLDTAMLQLAGLYTSAQMFDDALGQYDQWLKSHVTGDALIGALNGRCWDRAVLRVELDGALKDCNQAIKLSPKAAAIYDSRGLVRMRRGEFALAIADYDTALNLQPKLSLSRYARGVAKMRNGDQAGGEADIREAESLEPKIAERAEGYGIRPTETAPQSHP